MRVSQAAIDEVRAFRLADEADEAELRLDAETCCKKAVREFAQRVCARAESNMEITGRLEGAHYAALVVELARLGVPE